jgi:hypothetical protein
LSDLAKQGQVHGLLSLKRQRCAFLMLAGNRREQLDMHIALLVGEQAAQV